MFNLRKLSNLQAGVTMDNRNVVTILTPTYNRAHQLKDLYESLCKQTDKRFVWCVVDDGSTDNTEKLAERFIKEGILTITYIKKDNGGKHTALNMGIAKCETPLTFIVDSDDTLTTDAIKTVIEVFDAYEKRRDICGFSFLRAFLDGRINGKPFPKDMWEETYIGARVNSNDMSSDKAEVYRTECLLEFPFPEFKNERFLGEDVVWIRMARRYKTVHVNKAIYVGQYQEDGLTQNRRRNNLKSPNGCVARAKEYLGRDICLKMRIKGYLQYLIYGSFADRAYKNLLGEAPDKLLCLLLTVPAIIIKNRWKKQQNADNN